MRRSVTFLLLLIGDYKLATGTYRNNRYYNQRKLFIEKLGGKCVNCGSKNNLQFDHVDPFTKSYDFSSYLSDHSVDFLKEESLKCQLLCKTCHIDKHTRHDYHGTLAGYTHKKCRCDLCKKVWNAKTLEYKRNKNKP